MYRSREIPHSKLYLLLMVVTSLIGDVIYLKVASLYQFLFLFLTFLVCYSDGLALRFSANNQVVKFFMWMSLEAAVSIIWAPDKGLAAKYTYYVFMIFLFAYLFDNLLTRDNIHFVNEMMVFVLFIVNLIGVWESITNHHIHSDYLVGDRSRLFAYVPGVFFRNPNDLATYIIQILPFSMIICVSKGNKLRNIAIANIFLSVYVILRAETRTLLILVIILLVYFLLLSLKKGKAVKLLSIIAVGSFLAITLFPPIIDYLKDGLSSISTDEVRKSSGDGGSLGKRIALLQNGIVMLMHSFGFGVGAGCHRVLMKEYSKKYFYTGGILPMHNLMGEIFTDYGLIIGGIFLSTLVNLIKQLRCIAQNNSEREMEARLFMMTLYLFLICGISSSSIIQQTSVWITFCYVGAFAKINYEELYFRGKRYL